MFESRLRAPCPSRSCLAIALVSQFFIGLACGNSNGGGSLSGDLVVELSWGEAVDLDLGSTNPPGDDYVAANYESEPDAAPNCVHSGDTPLAGTESFTCTKPVSGRYRVVIDNWTELQAEYELRVSVGGEALSGFPVLRTIDAAPVGGRTTKAHEFTL